MDRKCTAAVAVLAALASACVGDDAPATTSTPSATTDGGTSSSGGSDGGGGTDAGSAATWDETKWDQGLWR